MKVRIDAEKCCGHALCFGAAPEAFEFLDLEDRAEVRDGAVDTVDPQVFLSAAQECPERAIIVELDS